MGKAKKILIDGNLDITREISAKELLTLLKAVVNTCPDAIVTIRQTDGTDFPPFLSIESQEYHDETDREGVFVNQLN